jgi:hypothetical protein
MPRIKKLVLRDPVGVPSSCCTTADVRISSLDDMIPDQAYFNLPPIRAAA